MKNITLPKVSIGFAIGLVILVVNISIADRNLTQIANNNQAELRSDRVAIVLANMLLSLKDIEIAQREYPIVSTARSLPADSTQELLRKRVRQIERMQQLVRSLSELSVARSQDRKIGEFQQAISAKSIELNSLNPAKSPNISADAQRRLTARTNQLIPIIRQQIIDFDRTEQIVIDRTRAESQSSLTNARITFGICGLLDLILLLCLYALVNWERSKQHQIELKLRDNATELAELYHNAPCGYHSLDRWGKFLRINRTELKLLGYSQAEIVGQKNILDLLTPESSKKIKHVLRQLKKHGSIQDIELDLVRKDGSILPVSATANAVYDRYRNYVMTRSTLINISDRINARKQSRLCAEVAQKIRASLELEQIFQTTVEGLQQLFDVDRVLIFQLAADGSGVVIQERVVGGYQSVIGSKIFDPCFQLSYHKLYQQGRISAVSDIHQAGYQACYLKFLQQFNVQATVTAPIHVRDKLWGLSIVHHCRSPRIWQEREIELISQLANQIGVAISQSLSLSQVRQQSQDLIRSNAELEQFAYVCSHDLQEPLRMVRSYLQLLSSRYQGKLDAEADEFIGYAVDGAGRMQALIQGLLSYARLNSRVQPFTLVNCDRILADAIANLQVAIAESGATIVAEPLPLVWGDETQLTQLFQNLIANAIKFRGTAAPQIRIGAWKLNSTDTPPAPMPIDLAKIQSGWCFSVADNGIGIEAEYLDLIFAIFQRLHPRVTYPGTGIGLAICKKIVEHHNGKIWVESTPKRGSTFYFIIDGGNIPLQYAHKQSLDGSLAS